MSLTNKTAIVTGCSSGIGLATTQHFLSLGARVFGIDITPFPSTPSLPSQSFTFHACDLTHPTSASTAVAACKATYGPRIDILANIAGLMDVYCSADSVSADEWERVIAVNLTAPVLLMQAVLPGMKEQRGGAIVNVGSYASVSGAAAGVAYTASKAGLLGATRNVGWRFHLWGVRCNAVLPSGVPTTNMLNSSARNMQNLDQEGLDMCAPLYKVQETLGQFPDLPKRETIQPEDVAKAIAFLASDDAKMINGIAMPVDNATCVL